jgi:5-formyltetrahydrofolate cyclo-ligase
MPASAGGPFRSAEIGALAELAPGPWGLLQPPEKEAVWVDDLADGFDLVVVPGVAFDLRGHRIGHGGGFYDRVLYCTQAYKVGLVYGELLLEEIPNEPHDIPVDAVVTESATHICQRRQA